MSETKVANAPGDASTERVYGHAEHNYLNHEKGLASWLLTLDHKRIGVMYLVGIVVALLIGGFYALLVRFELWNPGEDFLTKDEYNNAFTVHGAVMTFLVIIPGIPAVLGNFVLPIMLGAKDVAFPRLNLLSFYLWVMGAVLFVATLFLGGVDTGWTFYTPYSIQTQTAVITAVLGAFILGFSSILTGLNFITTIHKMRAKGMGWFKMPLFLWSLYATAVIQILATPVVGITLLLLIAERTLEVGIFNPFLGGDPVLFQHFFWFYSHPAVYIMILPGMGVISELLSTGSRKHIFGYSMIAISSVAIALLGFLVWGHHMFTSGQSELAGTVFSAITYTIAIPSAIKVFNWLATIYKGAIHLNTPMLYGLSFLWLFLIGGLTGVWLANLGTDIHLHDTYFVVAHFHFVMVGSTIIAFLGGLHYWWPKMFGRMYNEGLAKLGCLLVVVGFSVTFLPQFALGTRGGPRRYAQYVVNPDQTQEVAATSSPVYQELQDFVQLHHQISTVGAVILAAGMFLTLFYLAHSMLKGKKATQNPWGGVGLEWTTTTPPHPHNFETAPKVPELYEFTQVKYDRAKQSYVWTESGEGTKA